MCSHTDDAVAVADLCFLPCSSHMALLDTLNAFPIYTIALGSQGKDVKVKKTFWDGEWFIFPTIPFIIQN